MGPSLDALVGQEQLEDLHDQKLADLEVALRVAEQKWRNAKLELHDLSMRQKYNSWSGVERIEELEKYCTAAKEASDNLQQQILQLLGPDKSREIDGIQESQEDSNERIKNSSTLISSDGEIRAEEQVQVKQGEVNLAKAKHREMSEAEILHRLSTIDFENRQRKLRRGRLEGSGAWLIASPQYQTWLECSHSVILCCYGPSGFGKSVLSSIVIDHNLGASYHYCDYADKRTLNADAIITSLTYQLLVSGELPASLLTGVCDFLDGEEVGEEDASRAAQLLLFVIRLLRSGVIVIDGLDKLNSEARTQLAKTLENVVQDKASVFKIFVTSREAETELFSRCAQTTGNIINLRISDESGMQDIQRYIESEVQRRVESSELVFRDPKLMDHVIQVLTKGAQGMFLWVSFQVDDLCKAESDFEIRQALVNLPRSLSEAYDRLFSQIGDNEQIKYISKMFKWILSARRPLTLNELAEAIAFDVDDTSWDARKIPTMSRLLQVCKRLIEFDEESQTVKFSHYTVQQYLLSHLSARKEFRFTKRDANNTIGELCVTYLSFSDFETQLIRAEHSSKSMSLLTRAINEESTPLPGQGAGSKIIWKHSMRLLGRHMTAMQDISYNLGHLGHKNAYISSVLGDKFCLLDYIVQNWLWHTRYFLQDIPETSVSFLRFQSILSPRSFLFEITPWSTSTFSATSSHPHFPQEYLSWLETVLSLEAVSVTNDVEEEGSRVSKLPFKDETSIELRTAALPTSSKTRMAEEIIMASSAGTSPVNGYDSDQDKEEEMDSDVSSVFSSTTTESGTSTSSVPLLVVQGADEELVAMLAEDEILRPLYVLASTKLSPERFERNFSRLLKLYAGDLREKASDNLQKLAATLVRSRRRRTAESIRVKFFASAARQSYSSEEEDRDSPAFLNLDHVRSFMSSGDALPNLRDRLKSFLEPKPAKEKEVPIMEESIQLPQEDSAAPDEAVQEIVEEQRCGRIDSRRATLNYPAELQDLENASEAKQLEPEPDEKMSPEQKTNIDLESEQCNNGIENSHLERLVMGFQAKLLEFVSLMIYRFNGLFLEPSPPTGTQRLRWSCKCGHISYDDFTQLSTDGLPQMLEELKNSGSVTAASIETGAGSTVKGGGTWPLLLALGHRLQRSVSRRLKKTSLPVSEVQAPSASQSPHQPRADCKFLQVCVEKGPYSTRMHHIDVCDKKTDRDIFRALKKDYKEIRRELNSLLFKIHRIDFVEFQLYPKELVDSLIPDRLPPPAPENIEYEYLPLPPQTQPPVPQKLMMHLWHCREEFAPGDFYSKRFPKKKKEPCKFILDDNPTANLAWGLHIVETLNISLIIWILFGLTAVSGLVFCISWSLLRNDVSGAFTVSSYITALMTLLIMAVMSVLTRI